jgi:thiosulfate/3-mercaptopyruvate sulfurtransferase
MLAPDTIHFVYTTLVSTDLLAANLDAGWAVIDCRYDLKDTAAGRAQYAAAHIPGAVYASLSHDLSGAPDGTNGRHPLPSPDALTRTFSGFGIGGDTQVVVYDEDSGMFASRLWWMLRYMGHTAVALLDGGSAKWTREGRPVRGGEEQRPPAPFRGRPREAARLSVAGVERLLADRSRLLVDARAPDRFAGQNETLDRAAGHIPGAANHFFRRNVAADGTLLPRDQLRAQFDALLGGRAPEQVVMYCGSGVTACQNLLAMEHAGLPGAKLYPGSWSEWSSDPTRPREKE